MRRPFSTITALLLLLVAASQGARLWFGLPITIDRLPVSTTASWALIGIALALAIGLWFEARMHAHLAYGRRGQDDGIEPRRSREETFRAPKSFTVRKGRRYKATIVLGFFEQVASNDTIAGMLTDAGFADVVVAGSGSRRMAEALWPGDDTTADMPSQVISAVELPPIIVASADPKPAPPAAPPRPTATAAPPPAASPPPPPQTMAKPSPSLPTSTPAPGPALSPPPLASTATPSPRPSPPPPKPAVSSGPVPLVAADDEADATRKPSFASRFATALTGRAGTTTPSATTPAAAPPSSSAPPPTSGSSAAALRPMASPPPVPATGAPAAGSVPTIKSQKPPTDTAG
jgi:hypothetical protein